MLIRFRRWRFAVTADITKAFFQMAETETDQDVHQFVWDDQGTIRVIKFLRVPFGIIDAVPFCLMPLYVITYQRTQVPLLSQNFSPIFMETIGSLVVTLSMRFI